MTHAATLNTAVPAKNEVSPSVALYLGAALIVTNCLTTLYLPEEGILPTLFLIGIYQTVCLVMPDHLATSNGRRALVIAGGLAALMCHFSLTWIFQLI